jgi:L-ascorbate metabolism protein UlaG (beta-lactamase superfamily)
MRIKFLGHGAVEIVSESGLRILTDPYFIGCEYPWTGGSLFYAPITEPYDIVMVSHEHPDHNRVSSICGNPEIVRGMDIRDKGKVNVKGIDFWSIGCYHDNKEGKTFAGKTSIICCEVDGVKVGHSGDLGHIPTKEQLDKIKEYGMDIFLLCIGVIEKEGERYEKYVIDTEAKIMTGVWEAMKPIIHCLIPIHYRSAKCDFRFITLDEFIKGKTDVRHCYISEMCFHQGYMHQKPYILVLPPAL